MKISWNWLKRHVDLSGLDARETGARFTMSVAELEGVEEFGATYDRVLAARVLAIKAHPGSEKLSIVTLDTGGAAVDAVSGAPGIRVGSVIPFALPGVVLEGLEGKPVVRETEVKGVRSPGVTCSESELGISGDHSGLMTFPGDTTPGTKLTEVLPAAHDYVLEIDNTSITHRPDLWGHRGIAREIAAMTGRALLPFDLSIPESDEDPLSVSVEAPDLCPRYTALAFGDLTIASSPAWMKLALSVTGVRPISNVVDITNFVMLDVGNPTHAFDARQIRGARIVVRRAKAGEVLTTLDGTDRALAGDDVVIADGEGGVALGGIMGGLNSEIQPDTSAVVLEAACFNARQIRRTSSRLGLRTEASARFEKGLDRLSALQATALFARLLKEFCPASKVASRFYDVAADAPAPTVIPIAQSFIRQKLGVDVTDASIRKTLEGLEFKVAREGDLLRVTVPTFRATRDITIPEDVVEEIGRIYGYDNVTPTPLLAPVAPTPRIESRRLERACRKHLAAMGYFEIMSYSFDSASFCNSIGYSLEGALELRNPISSDMPALRRSLLPNLLQAVQRNALSRDDFRLAELGRIFASAGAGEPPSPTRFPHPSTSLGAGEGGTTVLSAVPHQERRLAGAVYSRRGEQLELFRQVRGHVESLVAALGRGPGRLAMATRDPLSHPVPPSLDFAGGRHGGNEVPSAEVPSRPVPPHSPWLVAGKTLAISVGGVDVGALSVLNPVVRDKMKLRGRVIIFEINLEPIISAAEVVTLFAPLPRFPAVQNDLSVIVDVAVQHQLVESAIREAAGGLLVSVDLFALFRGEPIPEGKKSLSFHLAFRSPDRTLEDTEIQPVVQRVVDALRAKVGGEIRVA